MTQAARNLTDAEDGFLREKRYLIHDRDPLFTQDFQNALAASGVKSVKLPPLSPNLNAHAECLFGRSRNRAWTGSSCLGHPGLRHPQFYLHEFDQHQPLLEWFPASITTIARERRPLTTDHIFRGAQRYLLSGANGPCFGRPAHERL
jgi:hypothetical protein